MELFRLTNEYEKESLRVKVANRLSVPLVSIFISLLLSLFVVVLLGESALIALKSVIVDIVFNQHGQIDLASLANIFFFATPLILTGLSVAVAFRAGMFNIGTEGQMMIGGLLSALVGSAVVIAGYDIPPLVLMPILIIVGVVGGSLWALVPALLKTRGVHEVITTIMMNYIASFLTVFLIGGPSSVFSDKNLSGNASPQTAPIPTNARIPTIFDRSFSLVDFGLMLSIGVCILIYIMLWKTKLGYETRAVGYNPSASKYGGISVNKSLVKIMLISGGIGGLAGALVVMGPLYGFYLYGSTAGLGFDGIAVALIGENHPIGVIFGALLFGWLQVSSTKLQQNAIPKDIANTMKGFIVLIIAVPLFSKMIINSINGSSWYNQAITRYKAEKAQKNSSGGTIKAAIMFPKNLLIFGTITSFNHLEKQTGRFFSIILRKKLEISVLLGSFVILVSYLEISGIISLGELGLSELLFRLPGIGLVFSLLSDVSTNLYLADKNLYISLISGVITITFYLLFLLSKKYENYSKLSNIFMIFLIPIGILLFFNLILLVGQNLVLLATVIMVLIFILFQEYSSHRITTESDPSDPNESEATGINLGIYGIFLIFAILAVILENFDLPFSLPLIFFNINNLGSLFVILGIILIPGILHFWNNKKYNHANGVNRYIITIGGFGTLTCVIVMLEKIPLSSSIDLFFFTISNLGALISLLGLISLIVCYRQLKKTDLPQNGLPVSSLPLLFILIGIIYSYISLALIFTLNPFLLFTQTLSIATPIGFAALGGMYSEKSGVVNIGLEGMMLTGAFTSVWVTSFTKDPWMGVLGAIIAGGFVGLIHAVASIKFRADQVVVGVAINILASAVTTLLLFVIWGGGWSDGVVGLTNIQLPFLADIPIVGDILYNLSGGRAGLSPLVYIFILLIFISYWIIERTSFGLRVRAVGEHPRAADTLGINVFQLRYICVILSGMLAAVGGAQLTLGWAPVFGRDMTTGRGFLALAALIFGGWSAIGAGLASLFFGLAIAFRFQIDALGIHWAINLFGFVWEFEKLMKLVPYVVTIIAVATVAKRMRPPAADGIPYEKEG